MNFATDIHDRARKFFTTKESSVNVFLSANFRLISVSLAPNLNRAFNISLKLRYIELLN